jgi:hypothetical protein
LRVPSATVVYMQLMGCGLFLATPSQAWVFPEHVELTRRALSGVESQGGAGVRAVLGSVRAGLGLCLQEDAPGCAPLATLVALAGDHSCTPQQLGQLLLEASSDRSHWVHDVLAVGLQTRQQLAAAGRDAAAREDVRRQMHVDLQGADGDYLARALVDYSHFQLTSGSGSRADLSAYLSLALAPAAGANATAAYVNYHVVAVRLAAAARTSAEARERDALLVRAFLAEAFALHFLEDSFSSGHFVGHWGDAATRLGTHDFYSRVGVDAARWAAPSEPFVAHGDAFLSDGEATAVALAARSSLGQVVDAATDESVALALLDEFRDAFAEEAYDSCQRNEVPYGLRVLAGSKSVQDVVMYEPIPARRFPPLTRVRAEKGVFLGGAATVAASYTPWHEATGSEIRAAVRVGVGAAGIVEDPLNAQGFVEAGFVGQHLSQAGEHASLTGYSFRIRAPGYVTLLDGAVALVLAEVFEADCPFCLSWGAAAAGGGVGKLWKSHPLFGSVSWQISALRDVAVNWFRNEPRAHEQRWEVLFSGITARSVLPIAGEKLSQSTDFYLDLGPSLTFISDRDTPAFGAFVSFAMATRLFP